MNHGISLKIKKVNQFNNDLSVYGMNGNLHHVLAVIKKI